MSEFHRVDVRKFCHNEFKRIISDDSSRIMQKEIFRILQSNPVFDKVNDETMTLEQFRKVTHARMKVIYKEKLINYELLQAEPLRYREFINSFGMYDWTVVAKFVLSWQFFGLGCLLLGTSYHTELARKAEKLEIFGCFALTELSHGSDARNIKTVATFSKDRDGFILNTPNYHDMKFWIGNAGKTATHALVFAKLMVRNDRNAAIDHGVHGFVVQIRNTSTFHPCEGVTVGDIGSKIGLNGIDNGFIIFRNVFLPRRNLLNKYGSIDQSGVYSSPITSKEERFSIMFAALSLGRINIIGIGAANSKMATTIAIRYSISRRQFGNELTEHAIIDYPNQYCRLIPCLASFFVMDTFSKNVIQMFSPYLNKLIKESYAHEYKQVLNELHAISCAGKVVSTKRAAQTIQECREACGGHGFLQSGRLGCIRSDNDANLTYEGDNNVLLQQVTNFIIKMYESKTKTFFGTLNFFLNENNGNSIIVKSEKELLCINNCTKILEKMVIYIAGVLPKTLCKNPSLIVRGEIFPTNGCLIANLYGELTALNAYNMFLNSLQPSLEYDILYSFGVIFALSSINNAMNVAHEANCFESSNISSSLRTVLLEECKKVQPFLNEIVDCISPPDFVLNSSLGMANRKIYENILQAVLSQKNVFKRADFWEDILDTSHLSHL